MPEYLHAYDLSLSKTGVAIFDTMKRKKKDKLIHYTLIDNRHLSKADNGLRLLHLEMALMTLKAAYPPSHLIREKITGNEFGDTVGNAQAHGVFERVFHGTKNKEIHNMTFKAKFGGHGRSSKEDIMNKVREELGIPDFYFITDDISDAIGLGIYELKQLGKW